MECEAITTSKSSPSERPVGSISILVVDDDLTCLSIVAAMLKKFKYQVVTVKHPKDALCTLRIKEGTFDLVVSDVHMPDMDGFELQRVIAQEFNLPVVLMSADDQEVTLSKGLESGAAFFIVKPLSSDVLKDLWRYADTKKKTPVTIQEIGSSTDEEETSSEKNNVDAITVSESSVDEDVHVKKDSKKKSSGKMASDDDKKEASVSSSPKRPKLVWTNSLHNRFLEAIRKLGLDKAVPKKILELMDVPGLTRENVASHLQKYRIFLRRVSDASYEIHYGPDMGLTHSLISSLTSPRSGSSTPILNSVTKGNYQNPGLFQDSNISRPVPNPSASSSDVLTGSGIARLLSNKENFSKPNITSPSPLVREIDHSLLSFAQNGYQTSPNLSKYDLPSASCNVSSNMGTSSSIVSTYRTKYVGYSLSNLKHLTESASFNKNKGLEPGSIGNIIDLANHEVPRNNILNLEDNFLDENTSIYDVLAQFAAGNNNDGGKQLSDIIQDYQMLISDENLTLQSGMENGVGLTNGEDACSPLFDLDELDTILPNEQSLDGGEMYFTTLADQPASENQQQAQQVQQCHVSQETDTTSLSQANQIDQQQARNRDFSNSLEFNASPQLDNIFLFPTEGEDEEFLESLLASFPGENPLMESNQV